MNILKEKLATGGLVCGTHVSMVDPCLCELLGYLGYDFIWVDMEHSYIGFERLMAHLNAAKAAGVACIVRVPVHDLTYTKKVLEMGVDGIVFPMVESAEEARTLLDWSLYPPLGNRGFSPMRAVRYGMDSAMEYIEKKSLDLCRFIQIERASAVEDLDQILQLPHIDGYIFGANDLSGSIGELGHPRGENTDALIRTAVKKLQAANKPIGISIGESDSQTLQYWYSRGIRMISSGTDYAHVFEGAKATLERMRRLEG